MMWDLVMERVIAKLDDNATLHTMFSDKMRMASGGIALKVPSLEYTLLTDITAEVFDPLMVQIDVWTFTAADNRTVERIIRTLLHQRTSIQWDGVTLFSEFMDGATLSYPDRAGYVGRGLRFRFAAMKQQFTQPVH